MNKRVLNFILPSISSNKTKLQNEDYKIIKVMENFLMNLPEEELEKISGEYNIKEVITSRRAIREKINNEQEALKNSLINIK